MIVLGAFVIGVALALDLCLDDGVARHGSEMIERPARARGPMVDQPRQLRGAVRVIMMAVEGVGIGPVQRVEHEAARRLEGEPLLVGEQPLLLCHPRRLPPQHRRHRVLRQPVDLIFRRCRRHTRPDEARAERGVILAGGKALGDQRAFVGVGHGEFSCDPTRLCR